MTLQPRENILHRDGAGLFEGFISKGGELVLTNRRLLFYSNNEKANCEIEIPISDIISVNHFKTLDIVPNGLSFELTDKTKVSFVVDERNTWCDLVNEVLQPALQN